MTVSEARKILERISPRYYAIECEMNFHKKREPEISWWVFAPAMPGPGMNARGPTLEACMSQIPTEADLAASEASLAVIE
jgi:hypothetical protein